MGPLVEWETDKLGLGNCEMAAQLLQEWRFPAATIAAIRDHYEPAPENAPAHLLNLAASAADRCGHGLPGESSYWTATPEKLAATGLTESDLDEATRRGLERFGPVRAALG